jgi:hypothetical protein
MAENYKHIFISGNVKSEKYKASPKQGKQPRIPPRDRTAHSAKLLQQFAAIWTQKKELEQARTAEKIATREGTYLSFTSAADHDLITKSLENIKKGIRLLNVKEEIIDGEHTQVKATVYIPNGMEGFFISKIAKYETEDLKSGKPKNAPLVNSIDDVSIALLEGLWTDKLQLIPTENSKWCEAWLNVNTKDKQEQEQIALFLKTLESIGIEFKRNTIIFPERAVLLINANKGQLIELMLQSDLLAEFRAGQEPAGFWVNESAIEQQAWVDDLLLRIEQIESNIKVCVLDSGVNNGHQLLQPLIDNANTLTVDNAWGTNDHESGSGHGTLMAGIAGYGQMESILVSTANVSITHRICSVKILPPPTQEATPKELWGDVTAQAIARAEILNPEMILIYCMSVTSKQDAEQGRPSSWSGAIDNLAFGDGENQRLIIISAGNIRDEDSWKNYPASNYVTTIENPSQSWNSVVIGAYTDKNQVNDDKFKDYSLVANQGELSPYSSTSLVWEKKWPVKPDVVFEGGNLLKTQDYSITTHEDLELISTSKRFNIKPFDTLNATSAAAAQASWFAAKIAFEYPNAWPETVRALIVNSAFWNDAMKQQQDVKKGNRGDYRKLLRVYGFGVPELDRALYSQESALTFVAQEFIQPFGLNDKNQPETNEIHFYNLPWPKEILLEMGNIPVRLRVTLSYFIEPGAGEIGWKDKYRYQSHGLRFDINNVGEEENEFRKRVNVEARDENEEVNGNSGSNRWVIGANNRSNGSIHSDYWEGTAADLATCNLIAVFPIIGWWRERKHLGKVENSTRYSLIISLETPAQDVELYTTVKNMIEVPIEIKTE